MDKFEEAYCKQNPTTSLPCGNPDCKKDNVFKTKDVINDKSFEFKCDFCGETTKSDVSKLKSFIAQLKKMGIVAK